MPFRSVVRLGSTTEINDGRIELNSPEAVKNSSDKLRMKKCFGANVKTALWWTFSGNDQMKNGITEELINISELPFPIVAKNRFGSRGRGLSLLNSKQEFDNWLAGKTTSNYIFEKYYSYNREYRLHVNSEGCFYTCRKMLQRDTPEDKRFIRNDSTCVWILEDNASFDKPVNWEQIVSECVKACSSVGLDFCAVDLRVQSSVDGHGRKRENPEFIVVEVNSAPSFGEVTAQRYIQEIPKMLMRKYEGLR